MACYHTGNQNKTWTQIGLAFYDPEVHVIFGTPTLFSRGRMRVISEHRPVLIKMMRKDKKTRMTRKLTCPHSPENLLIYPGDPEAHAPDLFREQSLVPMRTSKGPESQTGTSMLSNGT